MLVAQLKINGKRVNHHPGVNQAWDRALCGQDLMGDNVAGERWDEARSVLEKIDCIHCLEIIRACRALDPNDFK